MIKIINDIFYVLVYVRENSLNCIHNYITMSWEDEIIEQF